MQARASELAAESELLGLSGTCCWDPSPRTDRRFVLVVPEAWDALPTAKVLCLLGWTKRVPPWSFTRRAFLRSPFHTARHPERRHLAAVLLAGISGQPGDPESCLQPDRLLLFLRRRVGNEFLRNPVGGLPWCPEPGLVRGLRTSGALFWPVAKGPRGCETRHLETPTFNQSNKVARRNHRGGPRPPGCQDFDLGGIGY